MAGSICKSAAYYLEEMASLLPSLDCQAIDAVADTMFSAWQADRMIATIGNGGSASTASHFVADLVKTAAVDGQRRLRATCLSDNIGLLTAIGNDIHYDDIFKYPIEALTRPADVLIAISASGNSPNIVRACQFANDHGLFVVTLTGFDGGKISKIADLHVNIPSENYGIVEDLHLMIGHIITQSLRTRIEATLTCESNS